MKNGVLIFGYGSLMNEDSHTYTVGENHIDHGFFNLLGYERIFNACFMGNVYLNIKPNSQAQTIGNIIEITPDGFSRLKDRESGYSFIDVSDNIDNPWNRPIYTCFIEGGTQISGSIKQSYINKCWEPLQMSDRQQWLNDSIMLTPIEQDEQPIAH